MTESKGVEEGWPVRDRHELVAIEPGLRLLSDGYVELQRRDPTEAQRILDVAVRLMLRDGDENARVQPWLVVPDRAEAGELNRQRQRGKPHDGA